ncbi:porin [Vibrio diazotrophicus]|uniref:porin n=1 Tax=Vibrio diazotrophicus TaxID=685 RepID=UPI00142DF972|nr:porin [Vibrio diazotrophicus]NIY92517.1 porin [Vibrio diazotrophicus]
MKINHKKLLVISGLMVSSQAFALTIYQDETNKVDVSGAFLMDYWQPAHFLDHSFNTSRSTLGIAIENQLDNGWSTDVKFEWDTLLNPPSNSIGGIDSKGNYSTSGHDQFRSRLGYFTVNNEDWGSVRIGKQYSAYHDVAGYMDNLIVFDPDATPLFSDGKDGGFMATARGDNLVVYRKSFDALNLSAQYGFNGVSNVAGDLKRDSNMAIAVGYDFDFGLSLGATHMQNKVDGYATALDGDSQQITTLAAKYSNKGLQVSAAVTSGKKAHETDLLYYRVTEGNSNQYADATAYDLYAHYYFDIGLRPYVYLSQVNFDDSSFNIDGERSSYTLGLSYHATRQLIISGEVRKTEEDNLGAGKQEDTLSGMTVLYTF